MRISNIFKVALIAISYYSVKKVIDRYPEPYRRVVIWILRITFYLMVFLTVFAFFGNHINAIGLNLSIPKIIVNVLIGVFFVLSLFISHILSAVIEEIYRKLSEIKQETERKMEEARATAQLPSRAVKSSIRSTKDTLIRTGHWVAKSAGKIYEVSSKVAGEAFDAGRSYLRRFLKKKSMAAPRE